MTGGVVSGAAAPPGALLVAVGAAVGAAPPPDWVGLGGGFCGGAGLALLLTAVAARIGWPVVPFSVVALLGTAVSPAAPEEMLAAAVSGVGVALPPGSVAGTRAQAALNKAARTMRERARLALGKEDVCFIILSVRRQSLSKRLSPVNAVI